jgi:hypothetical protein
MSPAISHLKHLARTTLLPEALRIVGRLSAEQRQLLHAECQSILHSDTNNEYSAEVAATLLNAALRIASPDKKIRPPKNS